jgi:hypothetical protein
MNRSTRLVTPILLLALAACAAKQAPGGTTGSVSQGAPGSGLPAGWTLFADPEGRFTVQLPRQPVADKSQVDTALGKRDMVMYQVDATPTFYMVAATPLYLEPGMTFDEDKGLAGARDQAMGNMNAKVTVDRDLMVGSLKAKDLEFEMDIGGQRAVGVARVVVRGTPDVVLWQALAITTDPSQLPLMRAFAATLQPVR